MSRPGFDGFAKPVSVSPIECRKPLNPKPISDKSKTGFAVNRMSSLFREIKVCAVI